MEMQPAKNQERTFRNPLKKFLMPPTTSNDLVCSHRLKNKVYEVSPNHSEHVAYAIDLPKQKPNVTTPPDPVANLLKSLPIKMFRDAMTDLLCDTDGYGSSQAKAKCFEDTIRRDVAVFREEYIKMFDTVRILANKSSELMSTNLDYPLSAFTSVDVTVKALKEPLFTPGWKEVSVFKSYGPGRFYIKDANASQKGFDDAFTKWQENHALHDLEAFDGGSGYFTYFSPTSETFKGVYSLDYNEKSSVLDLDSGEIYSVLDFEQEIRLMPDEIRDSLNPVIAARLTGNISETCYTQFLNSIAKTRKVYVTGCEDGVLQICPSGSTESSNVSNVFCSVTSCLGESASKAKSHR